MLAAVKQVLGPEDKLRTLGYRLMPVHSYKDKSSPPAIKGYQAVNRLEVKVLGVARLGTVIDTALKNGATRVDGPYWSHSRIEELQRQAAVNALERARALAEALALAAGLKIKGVDKIYVAAALSAFMNDIAALVITMPIATEIARQSRKPAGATLMPLAFATILGGMTTLIGTPANLILSSVREDATGTPFGFFFMAPVGVSVAAVGLVYLATLGWRLLPARGAIKRSARPPWRVYELSLGPAAGPTTVSAVRRALRAGPARLVAIFRRSERVAADYGASLLAGDRLLVLSRQSQWVTAARTGLTAAGDASDEPGSVTARVAVAFGSFLVGLGKEAIPNRSRDALWVVAVGPRAARLKQPLDQMRIQAGDQIYLRGQPAALARFIPSARLLEIDRLDQVPVARRSAVIVICDVRDGADRDRRRRRAARRGVRGRRRRPGRPARDTRR